MRAAAPVARLYRSAPAIRQLAYVGATKMFDEYLHIGEMTARECLKYFFQGVRERYLRKPTPEDCHDLMAMHRSVHGFLRMLDNIDCTHWEWENCPTAWKEMYTTGFKGKNRTMILETVADYRLWIWHAYFGVAESNNDVNVLQSSLIFNKQCMGGGPTICFVANGNQHDMGYYLADEIYSRWHVFMKTVSCPIDPKKIKFSQR